MRPEKAKYLVGKAIQRCLKHETFYFLVRVRRELEKLLRLAVKDEHPYECENYYDDCRSFNTLMYISDRWNCTGRIKWLLEISKEQGDR